MLYQFVERHYPEFLEQLSHQGKSLPKHVEKEFEEFLKCVRLEHGFLSVVCEDCKHEKLVAFSCKKGLSLINPGKVKYELKAPYSYGTTHVFFSPLDFIGKLAALVPPPRLNLTRFYGVSAPNSKVRAKVTASQLGKNSPKLAETIKSNDKPYQARSLSWAQ